jgi:hypothetical protein
LQPWLRLSYVDACWTLGWTYNMQLQPQRYAQHQKASHTQVVHTRRKWDAAEA